MAIEVGSSAETELEEVEPVIKLDSYDELLGNLPRVQDLPLIKCDFHPADVEATRYSMQQLQLLLSETEPVSIEREEHLQKNNPKSSSVKGSSSLAAPLSKQKKSVKKASRRNRSSASRQTVSNATEIENTEGQQFDSNNECRNRTRRKASCVPFIYSENEIEESDSDYSPTSPSLKDSDSLSDEWTPQSSPPRKRKKVVKKAPQKNHSSASSQSVLDIVENTESQQSDSTNNSYICNLCNETFKNEKTLFQHARKMHISSKPFACNCCDKFFTATSSVHTHVRLHTEDKPYSCTNCDKELQQSLILQSDPEKTTTARNKKSHQNEESSDEETFYECKYCGLKFTLKKYFEKHLNLHEICKSFQCKACDRQFYSLNDLLKHEVKIHGVIQLVLPTVNHSNTTENISKQLALSKNSENSDPSTMSEITMESIQNESALSEIAFSSENEQVKESGTVPAIDYAVTHVGTKQLPLNEMNQVKISDNSILVIKDENPTLSIVESIKNESALSEIALSSENEQVKEPGTVPAIDYAVKHVGTKQLPLNEMNQVKISDNSILVIKDENPTLSIDDTKGLLLSLTSVQNTEGISVPDICESYLSLQQSSSVEQYSFSKACQKTATNYETALLEKEATDSLNETGNAVEREQVANVSDNQISPVPVLVLVPNISAPNFPTERVEEKNSCSSYETEESMNSLGIFFES